jgi:hypothetical protein
VTLQCLYSVLAAYLCSCSSLLLLIQSTQEYCSCNPAILRPTAHQEKYGDMISHHLPSECGEHMSSYLTLKECLTLASSSRRCLLDIIPVLEQRRARMVQPYAITMIVRGSESQYQLPPSPTSSMDSSCLLVEEKDEVKRTKQKNEEEITFGLLATLRREYDDFSDASRSHRSLTETVAITVSFEECRAGAT